MRGRRRVVAAATGVGAVLATLLAAPAATSTAAPATGSEHLASLLLGPPENLRTTIVPGRQAIRVTWDPPTDVLGTLLGYDLRLDGGLVERVQPGQTSFVVDEGLRLGRDHTISVAGVLTLGPGRAAEAVQPLYIAPVTTRQTANPDNPLAGREWGVYLGLQDQGYLGWAKLGQAEKDRLATIAMAHKAKFFGRWIPDAAAEKKTREYIENAQAGDPDKLTVLTVFRMYPWEGDAWIAKRLPTEAEQAAYRKFINGMARAIGDERVAVVMQPDGLFAMNAYNAWIKKGTRQQALLPARMLTWTARTFAAGENTSVYVDMGSEDWVRGDHRLVAKWLKLCGVKHARGFSLNSSHKNYLDREILFAKAVSRDLARMGLPGKHAVIDTSDNGQPFAGREINPQGSKTPDYTPPGDIGPCTSKSQRTPCTALGIPPTTDVDHPRWGLSPKVARAAAAYVDAYLWVSRPWLPGQGRGGTDFSSAFARDLLRTWEYSPYFSGTP